MVILLALYSLGALLTVINVNYFYELRELWLSWLRNCWNCDSSYPFFFMTIFIGFLNYTNIRNISRSCTYVLLKIALVVFLLLFRHLLAKRRIFHISFSWENKWLVSVGWPIFATAIFPKSNRTSLDKNTPQWRNEKWFPCLHSLM